MMMNVCQLVSWTIESEREETNWDLNPQGDISYSESDFWGLCPLNNSLALQSSWSCCWCCGPPCDCSYHFPIPKNEQPQVVEEHGFGTGWKSNYESIAGVSLHGQYATESTRLVPHSWAYSHCIQHHPTFHLLTATFSFGDLSYLSIFTATSFCVLCFSPLRNKKCISLAELSTHCYPTIYYMVEERRLTDYVWWFNPRAGHVFTYNPLI